MPVVLGAKPDHGFDEPLGLLSDCHRRIERFLGVLNTVCAARAGGALNAAEREALQRATEYFRVAAPRHTQDEEESLFPQMRASEDPRVPQALEKLQSLEADHEVAGAEHAVVDELAQRWLEAGRLEADEVDALGRALAALQALYRRHIALEDEQIFPLAARVLSGEQICRLGCEMAARRGLAPVQRGG
jgi:hemerythrin-like domain-containing protein